MMKFTDTFYIDFDTLDMPGYLKCVEVRLRSITTKEEKRRFRIDLSDHPLYPKLCEYVKNNPPRENK